MKKSLFSVCSVVLASLLFFSCAESLSSSISFTLPAAILKNTTDANTSETQNYTLKINFTGDITEEYTFETSLQSSDYSETYRIQDLQTGSEIQITASIYSTTDKNQLYETEGPAKIVLQPGKNNANLVLTRCKGSADISIVDFTLKAEYTDTNDSTITIRSTDNEIKIPISDTDITFSVETNYAEELSYQWYFNSNKIETISTDAFCTINLSKNESVNVNDQNTLSCIITTGSLSTTVELSFYASEIKTSEDVEAGN